MNLSASGIKKWLTVAACGFLLILTAIAANSASIVNSRHDLHWAASLEDMTTFETYNNYGQVCVYCHTPHGSDTTAPLWNRTNPSSTYTMYNSDISPTMDTSPASTPNNLSLACLSCHDGTIAVDSIINMPGSGWSPGGSQGDLNSWTNPSGYPAAGHGKLSTTGDSFVDCAVACHGGQVIARTDFTPAVLGTDLSNDHPISMTYPTSGQDPYFHTTAEVNSAGLMLYENKIECSSCHDVHNPANYPFLRKSNASSELCFACHDK